MIAASEPSFAMLYGMDIPAMQASCRSSMLPTLLSCGRISTLF
jgi:hypothetical protein